MKRSGLIWALAFVLIPVSNALAGYSSLFVFGDSLSDSGNNAAVLQQVTPVPIAGTALSRLSPMPPGALHQRSSMA
jgi:phospholipase/lecithinase/hemolysin